jgi:uncharacterized repeat protein (TIGR01451 family)
MAKLAIAFLVASICPGAFGNAPGPRTLTFDDRVRAQKAIAGLVDARLIDVARMTALEASWKLAPTDEMLEAELRRLSRKIVPPERLAAIYEALDNDPFLVKECLARPILVDRLSRDLYAFDPALHARARSEAVELRRLLESGELSPWADYPGRSVFELERRTAEGVGQVSAIEEERDGFVLTVVLSETTRGVRVARYLVSKATFDERSGTDALSNASDPELFSFCAPSGAGIALSVDGNPAGRTEESPSKAVLLNVEGEPVASGGTTWTAPYTGVYFAQVAREAGPRRDEYLLTIDVAGGAGIGDVADLDVTAEASPEPVEAGAVLTLTIVVNNSGPASALDVQLLEVLPDATTFQSITIPVSGDGPWDCVVPAVGGKGNVSCAKKCFAPGGSATFTITVGVDPCQGNAQLTSTTTATAATADPDPANNTTIATTVVRDTGACDDGDVCTVGDGCGPGVGLRENFDGVSTPAIPFGWTSTLVTGPDGARPWTTVGVRYDTEPNSAFALDASDIRDSVLDSPGILIESPEAKLRFQNRYDLERDFDGGVLEIKIGDGNFEDILDAGGSFSEGAYNGTISGSFGSPISARQAWTGLSNGFVPTIVNLPAVAAGQLVVLRWRLATDRYLGKVGQWIDTISVSVTGRDVCVPGIQDACDDSDACTADACDPVLGCGHVAISCDDGRVCTDDVCDPVLQCVHTNNTASCDDHNACTLTDVCAAGVCVSGAAMACHDSDICTVDSCDPTMQCVSTTTNLDTSGFSAVRVDGRDLAILAHAWNSCLGTERYNAAADLDRQGPCVTETDFHLFMSSFGRRCSS